LYNSEDNTNDDDEIKKVNKLEKKYSLTVAGPIKYPKQIRQSKNTYTQAVDDISCKVSEENKCT